MAAFKYLKGVHVENKKDLINLCDYKSQINM